jgi:hypothetical protein
LGEVAKQVEGGTHKDPLFVITAKLFLMLQEKSQHGLIRSLTQLRRPLSTFAYTCLLARYRLLYCCETLVKDRDNHTMKLLLELLINQRHILYY